MSYWMIDAIFIGIIAIFALRGLSRGFVMAAVSALGFLVALIGAHYVMNNFSHHAEGLVEPFIRQWVDSQAERLPGNFQFEGYPDARVLDTHTISALRNFGINENLVQTIWDTVAWQMNTVTGTFQNAITYALVETIARIFTFLIAFFLIWLIIRIIAQFLDAIAQLPILNFINRIGGLTAGLIQGAVATWLIIFVLYFTGIFGTGAYENSFMLRLFG
ncbi:MAG: CvpA family protein [Defluviitaleaceae bacterium]|nr:CvpA family protein [Defluviitaleaceae bacterium]MCL2274156.1 CvpA family protein [Defluviitaleaceae bacterium]